VSVLQPEEWISLQATLTVMWMPNLNTQNLIFLYHATNQEHKICNKETNFRNIVKLTQVDLSSKDRTKLGKEVRHTD
jgi:hypothetical protein